MAEEIEPEEIGFLRETKVFSDAEDVKTLRLIGARGTVDVEITDESMIELAEVAEEIFRDIHPDMAGMSPSDSEETW